MSYAVIMTIQKNIVVRCQEPFVKAVKHESKLKGVTMPEYIRCCVWEIIERNTRHREEYAMTMAKLGL